MSQKFKVEYEVHHGINVVSEVKQQNRWIPELIFIDPIALMLVDRTKQASL